MSEIKTVVLLSIDPNPHRLLAKYPFDSAKLKSLQHSMEDVGCWEGVIVRKAGRRYQAAFGHHRIEAAKLAELTHIPVILKELTDEDMLKYLGRENGDDYRAQFLVLLETWDAAVGFRRRGAEKSEALDIARFLGWTRGSDAAHRNRMNDTAQACHAAHALIDGGYLGRDDLKGLSVKAAREIVTRAHHRMEQLEKMAAQTNRTKQEVDAVKKTVAKGAKITARESREGVVPDKKLRGTVDVNTYKAATSTKVKDSPLFAVFGKALADSLNKMLDRDSSAAKLAEVVKMVNVVTLEADHATLRQLRFELQEITKRANNWDKKLIPTSKKVSSIPSLENKNA